jgi:N-acyl-D-amino-acid deacylase
MESDPYATGSALVALIGAGNVASDHASVQRVIEYLLKTQLEDGSWHVVTRAKPIQKYFESGFPHGKDQFISMAASSWSTWALLLALPETP